MINTEEIERAERDLEKLRAQLGELGCAVALARRNGLEARYGQKYTELVSLGARPRLKKKYRRVTG